MSDIFRDYSFGGWIRHARLEGDKPMTLRDFALKLGDSPGNVSRMENNETPPPRKAKKIEEICEALGKPDMAPLLKSIAFQHHLSKLQDEFLN
jgi:transcriptional regulator with XRE-family HTH domain